MVAAGIIAATALPAATLRANEPAAGAGAQITPATAAPAPQVPSAADAIAEAFSQVGKDLYEECIFELSEEQIEVQAALIVAYLAQGADGSTARKLAAQQIQPPKLSAKCANLRGQPEAQGPPVPADLAAPAEPAAPEEAAAPPAAEAPAEGWAITLNVPQAKEPAKPPVPVAPSAGKPPDEAAKAPAAKPEVAKGPVDKAKPAAFLASRPPLKHWDCGDNVDFVTVHINGYPRKLTGGEICNPYEDLVKEVPADLAEFRLGYVIKTGRLFIVSDGSPANGQTIAWAISGRDVCRNNPDPDCLAARALGPLPPGEYSFAGNKAYRINWGPKTKRHVAAIYLKRLWNKDRFSPQQTKAILARGNIAIHVRLKGEMSEACLGLEPKGWAYVAGLIKAGRATGVNVYIDEPHPQIAEKPPLVEGSSFSLTSLFK